MNRWARLSLCSREDRGQADLYQADKRPPYVHVRTYIHPYSAHGLGFSEDFIHGLLYEVHYICRYHASSLMLVPTYFDSPEQLAITSQSGKKWHIGTKKLALDGSRAGKVQMTSSLQVN